ncbi:MAG: HDOD domain-containing protein [Betaproteobacteria bacterium]|nr:HDOD domain-containing protein [Betaproteobacteria bacterium]
MDPRTFQFEVPAEGKARPGYGLIAAYVPAEEGWPAVVALACDPRHDPGRPIAEMLMEAIPYVLAGIGGRSADEDLCWTVVDALGRFTMAIPNWASTSAQRLTSVESQRFSAGLSVDAFLKETGAAGEVALGMLSAVVESPSPLDETPSAQEFLDALESHDNLPVPSALFHMVEDAVKKDDAKRVAAIIQSDPVVSLSLINFANTVQFAGTRKTASVPQAVVRLGMEFVLRVVFVATMMARYQKGRCAEFDYPAYWRNALATGIAMRALLPGFGIAKDMEDDAFATGLVSGIGWLAVAETYPQLMSKYLKRCRGKDPLVKIRIQQEIFPCPIRLVSERLLQHFSFPDIVHATVAGKSEGHQALGECLARATRVAQSLAPLGFLAVLPMAQIPLICQEEWERWQVLFSPQP